MSRTVREMARALDDAALETLASKGLVRRAKADAATGRAAIVDETADAAELRVDGETVRVLAQGPTLGGCSCPAPGMCRHRLAALVLLQAPVAAPLDHQPPQAVDWVAVIEAFTPERLERFAGPRGWRQALAQIDAAPAADVAPSGASLRVRLEAWNEAVLFPAIGGLDAALTKAPETLRKVRVVVAALAARHAMGLATVQAAPEGSPVPADETDSRTLDAVRDVLRRSYVAALALAPQALEAEVRRLAVAGRVESMPRLAASLHRLAGGFGPLRRRDADASPDAMLELMAEISALATALASPTDGTARLALTGQARQDYAPLGDLHLYGLGARLWTLPSGARGVTAYFHSPATGASFTLTHARADRADTGFDPQAAFYHAPIWGSPMARLCAAEIRLNGALASASGRLSMSQAVLATLSAWTPSAEAVHGWNCVHADWQALERWLQGRLGGRLTSPPPSEAAVVLAFARTAPVRFDEFAQALIWPVADGAGRWIGLTLPYEGVERGRITALEQLIPRERAWAVLATAVLSEGRIELRPYALWGGEQRLLDFARTAGPAQTAQPSVDLAALMARLKSRISLSPNGPRRFAERRAHSDRLIDRGWGLLLQRAEQGRSASSETFARDCRELAGDLTMAGLAALARPFDAVSSARDPEDACLRAAWAVATARRMRARLAWMA